VGDPPEPASEQEPMPGKKSGDLKALIVASLFPEDTHVYYPAFYDSLIAPDIDSVDDSLYMWSMTNYFYTASYGDLRVTGSVNDTLTRYIVAPHSYQWYIDNGLTDTGDVVFTYERDVLEALDPYVNFNDYDADNDGAVYFVWILCPLDPTSGFNKRDAEHTPDSSNFGFQSDGANRYVSNDPWTKKPSEYVKVSMGSHFGSGLSYYHPDSTKRINSGKATNLFAHEEGHGFGGLDKLKGSNENFIAGLVDRYDPGEGNYNAISVGVGKYTVMQLDYYTPHPQLYTPFERMVLGWIEPEVIEVNSQNISLEDFFTTGDCFLIPVDSVEIDTGYFTPGVWSLNLREYFLVTNYQPESHWLNDMGWTWIEAWDSAGRIPHQDANGLLVWHVNERFWTHPYQVSELAKFEDLECAEGLMSLDGDDSSPFGTEAGWDRLDRWARFPPALQGDPLLPTRTWANQHNASTCHWTDFFNPDYKTAFHTLTNPSSDGYNCDPRVYFINQQGDWNYTFSYPGSQDREELLVLQNLPTHVSIEGIHDIGGGNLQMCIRRSRIWSDHETAMDRTTQRKFLYSGGTYHFVYPLRGHIYYTKSHAPDSIWYKAEMIGPEPLYYDGIGCGMWPAITLDNENEPLAVFYDSSCSKVIYSYRTEVSYIIDDSIIQCEREDTLYDTLWITPPCTLDITGDPGPVAIDFETFYGSALGGHDWAGHRADSLPLVHLAYVTDVNGNDRVNYACFFKHNPEYLREESVDLYLDRNTTHVTGASIAVNSDTDTLTKNKVCVAYGAVKNGVAASYYNERCFREHLQQICWSSLSHPLPNSESDDPFEPLVPFVDIWLDTVRVVFSANDSIFCVVKPVGAPHDIWDADSIVLDTQLAGQNRYPQIAGNIITWTNFPDSAVGDTTVWAYNYITDTTFQVDGAYCPNGYFCQAAVVDTGATPGQDFGTAYMYQHGTFAGPKWAVYYRSPGGFGGNMENEGRGVPLIIKPPEFTMALSRNLLRGNQFSVFTSNGECEVSVFDVSGRRIEKLEIEAGKPGFEIETRIQCDDWSQGVYFVRAVHNENTVRTKKLVLLK